MKIAKVKGNNVFVTFLELLKVKHTQEFSDRYFNEHPHKYNLFGISKMLSDYGIENVATRIEDKENVLPKIECPFVAHFGGDFAVVYKVTPSEVSFLWNGNEHTLPVTEFIAAWSGVVLLAETSEKSIEPNYKEHQKKDFFAFAQKSVLIFAVAFILGITFINQLFNKPIQLLSYSIILLLNLNPKYKHYFCIYSKYFFS